MKHLSSAAKLPRLWGTGSGSNTGYRWCVPVVRNHCDSPPWKHQGLSATLYPAQRDINNSAFSSQRENIPFPTCLSCASKQKRKQARLWLSLSRSHTSRHLPSLTSRSLYGSLISTHEDFLCVQSIVSNRGLSVSHLNPTVDSVAACSSAAGQHHPGQHSAAACSGEIRQSSMYTTGILSQTRGDRLQEIFWRVATRGPERDSAASAQPVQEGTGWGWDLRANSSAAGGERVKTVSFAARCGVVHVRHRGPTPGGDRQLSLSLEREFLLGWGWKEAADAGAGGAVPALLSAKYYRTLSHAGIFNLS